MTSSNDKPEEQSNHQAPEAPVLPDTVVDWSKDPIETREGRFAAVLASTAQGKFRFALLLLALASLLLSALGFLLAGKDARDWLSGVWGVLEPLTGIPTLLLAFLIWSRERREAWVASLPKRLHVVFEDVNGKWLMVYAWAVLSSESDIRQWAQQIGQQMTGGRLDFLPSIRQSSVITKDPNGQWIQLFTFRFHLLTDPEVVLHARAEGLSPQQEQWRERFVISAFDKNATQRLVDLQTIAKSRSSVRAQL